MKETQNQNSNRNQQRTTTTRRLKYFGGVTETLLNQLSGCKMEDPRRLKTEQKHGITKKQIINRAKCRTEIKAEVGRVPRNRYK